LNELGKRIGESHQNATRPDHVIDEMRRLHEHEGWSYRRLAAAFNMHRGTVAKICRYERRAQVPTSFKEMVPVS
jgi:AraC-like DNA-binding protein